MIKLVPVGKWITLKELEALSKEVEAQATLIEQAQDYIEDVEIEELQVKIKDLEREINYLDEENFSIPIDPDELKAKAFDMVRWYADKDDLGRKGQPIPHIEYGDSKRGIFVRTFMDKSKEGGLKWTPVEEPLESAPK